MKLFSSFLFAASHVDVLHLDDFGLKLDDFHKSVDLVHLDQIDYLLLQELGKVFVDFPLYLGVFEVDFLELTGQKVNQVLSPCILNGHLYYFALGVKLNEDISHRDLECLNLLPLQQFEKIVDLLGQSEAYILSFELFDQIGEDGGSD
jgi:hypothetical protein